MAVQQAQANSRFPKDSPVMEFLEGRSKRWNHQPSMTAHKNPSGPVIFLARQIARSTET